MVERNTCRATTTHRPQRRQQRQGPARCTASSSGCCNSDLAGQRRELRLKSWQSGWELAFPDRPRVDDDDAARIPTLSHPSGWHLSQIRMVVIMPPRGSASGIDRHGGIASPYRQQFHSRRRQPTGPTTASRLPRRRGSSAPLLLKRQRHEIRAICGWKIPCSVLGEMPF